MPDTHRYADIYRNFQDKQQWLDDLFQSMTFWEYRCFTNYLWEETALADEGVDDAELRRVKGLLLALARKELEVAHFMYGLTDDQREVSLRAAKSTYELAKGLYSPDVQPAVEGLWNELLRHASRYGWPSVAFEIMRPQPIFREPTDEERRLLMGISTEEDCPRCNGTGILPPPQKRGDPDVPSKPFYEPTCPDCKGTGKKISKDG